MAAGRDLESLLNGFCSGSLQDSHLLQVSSHIQRM
ncbi:hypothetical protein ETAA8_19890 [Anatilimnocola aggregata]|uniref:Uncharacterized protein n=1 Tax=Anatilimnocola aggregata TaxID=2528021 RepID=A0A517Y9J1_9BACT|nr:hypothetical protein ETAA8_19890 [Anatilimnocola aggregata]